MQGEQGREALRSVVANGEFFLLTLPDGSRLVHPIAAGVRHPLNFGREVCAKHQCYQHLLRMHAAVAITWDRADDGHAA